MLHLKVNHCESTVMISEIWHQLFNTVKQSFIGTYLRVPKIQWSVIIFIK